MCSVAETVQFVNLVEDLDLRIFIAVSTSSLFLKDCFGFSSQIVLARSMCMLIRTGSFRFE